MDNSNPQYPFATVNFTEAGRDAVVADIARVRAALPPLPSLTGRQRRRLCRAGMKTQGFVKGAIRAAMKNPGVLPQAISPGYVATQEAMLGHFGVVREHLRDLFQRVDDSIALLNDHVYGLARTVYSVMGTPVVASEMDDDKRELKARFARKKANPAGQTASV